jgi:hypothetical protein
MSMENITTEHLISLASTDYSNEQGFFMRSKDGGTIRYIPYDNAEGDTDYIDFVADADEYFNDCRFARKILKEGTTATNIYVGQAI